MKSRHAAAIAVVVTILAGGWFIFLRGNGEGEQRPVATAGGAVGSGPASARGPQRPDAPDRGGEPEARVLVDDDPAGILRLEGMVLGPDDAPVPGATVVLSANPPRTTKTEDDGSFAFDKLVARPYTLLARAEQGVGGPVTSKLTATSDPVVLRLVPGGRVAVHVVDGKQQPLGTAAVELRGVDVQTSSTDATGLARFAPVVPGRYDVMAKAPGFAPGFAFAAVSGTAPAEVTVVLAPGAPVEGKVVDGAGMPVGDALVVYSGASDWSIRADERRDGVRSAADGSFRFDALPAGSFRFVARHPSFAPGTSALVTLDGASPTRGIEIRIAVGATVSGRVIDGSGAPVPSARVRIGVASRGMIGSEPRQVFAADDGSFEVTGLPRKALEAVALADRGSSATVPVDTTAGDVSGVNLTLDITGTIAGVVVDKQGEPLEGMQVSAFPDFRSGSFDPSSFRLRGFPQELTDAGGRFELVGLAPGAYMVRASRSVAGRGRTFGTMDGERAETGTRDLRIVLPADGSVKGKVALADGTVPTPFSVGVGFSQELINARDGSFVLGDLPPRKYQLVVRGATIDQKTVPVEVEEGEVTDVGTITVGKGRAIAGTVRMNGVPVAGATVYAGRQLFGSGSSNTAQVGQGPPGRGNNREATTDAEGHFTITGLGPADIAVVAEQPELGRSAAIRLQRGVVDEQALQLELFAFGQLAGKVSDAAGPAADTIVTVQSVTAVNAMYSVSTGPDGLYRFDRLAPDTYKVSAMLGSPMRGMAFHSSQVIVVSGQEARADLKVEKGAIAFEVKAKAREGEFRGGFAWLIRGNITARDGRELTQRVASIPAGLATFSVMFGGRPASFEDLSPGTYTVCVSALPTAAAGPQAMGYLERHGDELPTTCKPAPIADAPPRQSMEVTVDIPPMATD